MADKNIGDDAYKGAALTSFLRWYRAEAGAAKLAQALRALPPEQQNQLDLKHESLGVLQGSWYSAPMVHNLLDALTAGLNRDEKRALAARAGRAVIEELITGLYSGLFRLMASPELYAKYAPRLWSSNYRLGTFKASYTEAGEVRVDIRDWPGHHPLTCDINVAAAGRLFERMGCLGVTAVRSACVAQGAQSCHVSIQYLAGVRG